MTTKDRHCEERSDEAIPIGRGKNPISSYYGIQGGSGRLRSLRKAGLNSFD
jgi:hypothetical protein